MEKSSQIAWKVVPLRHVFPIKVVPLIEVLLYGSGSGSLLNRANFISRSIALELKLRGAFK
jgi:hypothetical protein